MGNGALKGIAVVVSLSVLSLGCAPTPENCAMNQTATGVAVGALAGGALGGLGAALGGANTGTGFAIAAGGAAVGALIGGAIGAQQDKVCRQIALNQALERAAAVDADYRRQQAAYAEQNRQRARQQTARRAPPAPPPPKYESVEWVNRSSNTSGKITPTGNVTEPAGGGMCMTFAETEVVNGVPQPVEKRACRGTDGQWNPV